MMDRLLVWRSSSWCSEEGNRKHVKGHSIACRKDFCSLLGDQEGELSFLLEDVLYVSLCCFKVDFQGGQGVLDVG